MLETPAQAEGMSRMMLSASYQLRGSPATGSCRQRGVVRQAVIGSLDKYIEREGLHAEWRFQNGHAFIQTHHDVDTTRRHHSLSLKLWLCFGRIFLAYRSPEDEARGRWTTEDLQKRFLKLVCRFRAAPPLPKHRHSPEHGRLDTAKSGVKIAPQLPNRSIGTPRRDPLKRKV